MLKVLVVDDHGIVIHGLEALLSTAEDIEVIGSCVDGMEAAKRVAEERPDVLILDLHLPKLSGLEVLSLLSRRGSLPPTILMAATAKDWQITEALKRGAWGVVMKDQAPKVILDYVYAAGAGQAWDRASMPRLLGRARVPGLSDLTPREREIARRAALGESNKAIARTLSISEGTVKTHLHRTFKKLGVANRVQLTMAHKDPLT